ncbi:hypothetical protein L1987_28977 [Smallanthus sonchifolius]|uniref:Uncharacterized protein n=1 Tax=Smallanthus sonchifolius TaxID=185202 RepID=A0ACB9HZJ6_9ASTR|nr:hypothetical protein L1987_28977 [Smallanthus sonchifolius]
METGGFGLEYWLQWQVLVCALIFLLPALISIRFITTKNNTPTTNSYHLWMPYWRNLHPIWLLLYRVFSFISMAYLLYQTVVGFGPFVFYFYTQWTFLLVTIYFALGTFISAHGCWMLYKEHSLPIPNQERDKFLKKDSSPVEDSMMKDNEASIKLQMQFNQEAGFWGNLMQNIYQTCAGAVVLTDIVFWCLLLPFQTGDDFKLTLLIGCMHSVNAVFLLMDSALNSLQFSWHGLTYFVLWSSTYIVFQWVMNACCFTRWPYPFLELATPWAPMWYFGIALFHLPCYGLYLLLVKAKVSMFPRSFIRAVANEKQM